MNRKRRHEINLAGVALGEAFQLDQRVPLFFPFIHTTITFEPLCTIEYAVGRPGVRVIMDSAVAPGGAHHRVNDELIIRIFI
jgi:hypothetical protein